MPLQYQQTARLLEHEGHAEAVTAVSFSPSGLFLASGSLDGKVCIWSTSRHKLLYVFSGKSSILSIIWIPPTDDHVVCGMEDGTIASLVVAQDSISIKGMWGHRYPVERLAFNGRELASGAHQELKVWLGLPAESCAKLADLPGPPKSSYNASCEVLVTSLHWTASQRHPSILMVTYMSHGIILIDGKRWTRLRVLPFAGHIADATLGPDARYFAVSNLCTGFDLYALKSHNEIEPIYSFPQNVGPGFPVPVLFIHGGHALIGGTSSGDVYIWDLHSRNKQPLRLGAREPILSITGHYNADTDEFLVAFGLAHLGHASPILIWRAKEIPNRRGIMGRLEDAVGTSRACMVLTLLLCAIAAGWISVLPYVVESNPTLTEA